MLWLIYSLLFMCSENIAWCAKCYKFCGNDIHKEDWGNIYIITY